MTRSSRPSRPDSLRRRNAVDTAVDVDATRPGYTGIKHVLACIDGTDNDRAVLDHALAVALRFVSHIDVLHVRFDVHGVSAGGGDERHGDRLLDVPVERAVTEAAAHARRHFEEWQAQCGLPAQEAGAAGPGPSTLWREIVGYESDVVARLGRLSDMIVIARPNQRSSSSSLMALETALFDTGRPVLMVPDRPAANLFHRPLVAWNGSLEAARAVGFALPFLAESEGGVDVVAAPERKHRTETEELLRYLSAHGIVAKPAPVEDPPRPVAIGLLAHASASRAGLIVMGAYTHGHYRQFFFGGVTRYVIEHAAVPVLLAH
jgi:nucleotide-binding universal stress UspA family protein